MIEWITVNQEQCRRRHVSSIGGVQGGAIGNWPSNTRDSECIAGWFVVRTCVGCGSFVAGQRNHGGTTEEARRRYRGTKDEAGCIISRFGIRTPGSVGRFPQRSTS